MFSRKTDTTTWWRCRCPTAWRAPPTAAPHAHAAAAAAVPDLRRIEWFHDHVRIESMFFDAVLDPMGGTVHPDGAIGHGLTLRADEVKEYRVA
ncbi:hypothetical protein SAURM35S_09479 [Streptomyces aurantiogriseus]|uniref:Enolase C-terminal domain-containing protein n=1 Tax=Streptomyces aurantiogriseus TaxID=66870 RepID=A0A918F458_9ACTN|nr:hypothetical protein GCM10010251_22060 [Streptomyces aurantiogriseus]